MVVNTLYYGSAVGRGFGTAPVAESSGISISDDIIAAALRNIYSRDFNPASDIEPNLFNAIAATLADAVTTGATVPGASALGKDPFLDALRHSTDVFAAFKTHRAQNDMAARLLDSNGNLKPFEQWKKEVLPIADHQCHNWLETEYNTAVLRARQAANWQQFQREKDILPNLKWLPSTSPNPGADHLPFWNTILPIDHTFWDQHRPGDRWNCKCDLTSTDEPPTAVPSLSSEVSGNNPQPGLKDNPGKTQALFSDDHPYFPTDCRHCPFYNPSVKARLKNIFRAQTKDCYHCPYIDGCINEVGVQQKQLLEERRTEYHRLLNDPDYKNVQFDEKTGGVKATHVGHNFNKVGGEYEKKVLDIGYAAGNKVILEDERGNNSKHIEGTWNNQPMEVSGKNGHSTNNIKKGLIHCAEKPGCKVAIIYFYENNFNLDVFEKALIRYKGLKGKDGPWVAFDEVVCMQNDKIVYQKSHPIE